MKFPARPVFVVFSAALAACCLLAGHSRAPASGRALPAVQSDTALQCAGQALGQLRRRARAAARRAVRTLLLCLAAPAAALVMASKPELWVELQELPSDAAPERRPLRLPPEGRDARPGCGAPPGVRDRGSACPARAAPGPAAHPAALLPPAAAGACP